MSNLSPELTGTSIVAGMPKERIEGAVKRGQGISPSGVALETLIMECMGPGSVALVM